MPGALGGMALVADGKTVLGDNIEVLASAVAGTITSGAKVALGFECPLYAPRSRRPNARCTKARTGEGNRSWSAGAGCGALATGLVEVSWLLNQIRANTPKICGSLVLSWKAFENSDGGLSLWDSSGPAKPGSSRGHRSRAESGCKTFRAAWRPRHSRTLGSEQSVLLAVGL